MTTRHKIAEEAEFPADGSRVIREVDGVEVAVFRIEGEYYALANHCIHQGGPLCQGDLSGRVTVADDGLREVYDTRERYVRCPWHGWIFDVTTGASIDAEQYTIPTYDVVVEDGEVFVLR